MNLSHIFRFFTLSLFWQLLLLPGLAVRAQSQLESRHTLPEGIIFHENFEPPGDDKPKGSSGAGSRDGLKCSEDTQSIRPLMPKRNYGLTFAEHPTIFISLPKTSAQQVVLTFQDEAGKYYQRAFLPITADEQIVSFTLPDDKPPLEVGKNYQWSLILVCGKTVQPDDPVVRGWVQRVAKTPKIESELRQKSLIEQAEWYANKGYWYDMLRVIVEARRSHPDNAQLTKLWQKLLNSVQLGAIISETLD